MVSNNKTLTRRKMCWNASASGLRANITNGILRMEKTIEETNYTDCCYKEITRKNSTIASARSDWLIRIENACIPIPPNGVQLNASFIQYECSNEKYIVTDFAATALPPERHSPETKLKSEYWKRSKRDRPPNVLLININSISHSHMLRSLPLLRRLALDKSFVELWGFTKVGENLFSNMMAILSGQPDKDYPCWKQGQELDHCPYLWKDFNHRNYVTALVEDSPFHSIFNFYKWGFLKQPVDYYNRPLMIAAYNYYNVHGTYKRIIQDCINSGTLFDSLYSYIHDFLNEIAGKIPYFLLASFKTYDGVHLNHIHYEDEYFHDLLKQVLTNPKYDGNNTLIVLFSTQGGLRQDNDFENVFEESLPMFLLRVPPSLLEKHPKWHRSLKKNAKILTTPLDLHATIQHLLGEAHSSHPGHSLFRKIPDRTCNTAGVPSQHCRCGWIPSLSPGQGVSPETEYSAELAQTLVTYMNTFLEPVLRKPFCEPLALKEVQYVQVLREGYIERDDQRINYVEFLVGFEVYPSEAKFEGLIREYTNQTRIVRGSITRQSEFNGENYCIGNDKYKPFCSCFEHNLQKRINKLKKLMKKSAGF